MADLVITPEIEADAQRLAEALGTTPTEAVAKALRMSLLEPPYIRQSAKKSPEEIDALIRRLHVLPVNRELTEDEILGYDEVGIPEQPYLGH